MDVLRMRLCLLVWREDDGVRVLGMIGLGWAGGYARLGRRALIVLIVGC